MPQQQPMTMTFSFDEMNLILKGLGELPAKQSIDLIQRIHMEWNKIQAEQQKQDQKETADKKRFQESLDKKLPAESEQQPPAN